MWFSSPDARGGNIPTVTIGLWPAKAVSAQTLLHVIAVFAWRSPRKSLETSAERVNIGIATATCTVSYAVIRIEQESHGGVHSPLLMQLIEATCKMLLAFPLKGGATHPKLPCRLINLNGLSLMVFDIFKDPACRLRFPALIKGAKKQE